MFNLAVLDSGFGGLLCFEEIKRRLENYDVNLIYLCDNKTAPYGGKSEKTIKDSVKNLILAANANRQIDAVFFACNTARAVCMSEFQRRFAIKFFGLKPKIKRTKMPHLVLATPHTCKSISKQLVEKNTVILPFEDFAKVIEDNFENPQIITSYLKNHIPPHLRENAKYVTLGCSHYKICENEIKEVFAKGTQILSYEKIEVDKVINYILHSDLAKSGNLRCDFIFSEKDPLYIDKFLKFYKNFICPQSISL